MTIIGRKQTPGITVQLLAPAASIERLGLAVEVDDEAVREAAPGFDGLERVFALIPRVDMGRELWQRVDLTYNRSLPPNAKAGKSHVTDDHEAYLNAKDFDVPAIAEKGIAFGMDTNVGTLWLQAKGENFKASK